MGKPKVSLADAVRKAVKGFLPQKPNPRPRLGGVGHRGVAAGSLKPSPGFARTGRIESNVSAGNVARWQTFSTTEVEDFLYNGAILRVHSSNVESFQYDVDNHVFYAVFLDGSVYKYFDVDENEAWSAATAFSKGGWVWDSLRIRGTRHGSKKKFIKLSGSIRRRLKAKAR